MATPQSTASGDAPTKGNLEQITFRFCSECSNMLYPKEDEDAHKLMFTCRTCMYTEEATSSCVFRHVLNNAVGETAGVTQDVGSDPTVCGPVSSHSSAVAAVAATPASAPITTASATDADHNPALCFRCGFILLQCVRCQDPASVDEYNEFVAQHHDFPVEQCLRYIGVANQWTAMDEETRATLEDRFSSFDALVVPKMPRPHEESVADYLPYDWTLESDADPPEALGLEPAADCLLLD